MTQPSFQWPIYDSRKRPLRTAFLGEDSIVSEARKEGMTVTLLDNACWLTLDRGTLRLSGVRVRVRPTLF